MNRPFGLKPDGDGDRGLWLGDGELLRPGESALALGRPRLPCSNAPTMLMTGLNQAGGASTSASLVFDLGTSGATSGCIRPGMACALRDSGLAPLDNFLMGLNMSIERMVQFILKAIGQNFKRHGWHQLRAVHNQFLSVLIDELRPAIQMRGKGVHALTFGKGSE